MLFLLRIDVQRDLDAQWIKLEMRINAKKCEYIYVYITRNYTINGEPLREVQSAKYLGVGITQDLGWLTHIFKLLVRTNSTLVCPSKLMEITYFMLVRSVLEYGIHTLPGMGFTPYQEHQLQHWKWHKGRAAHFLKYDYSVRAVSQEWWMTWAEITVTLAHHKTNMHLTLFYKIVHQLVALLTDNILVQADQPTRPSHELVYRHLQSNTAAFKQSYFP